MTTGLAGVRARGRTLGVAAVLGVLAAGCGPSADIDEGLADNHGSESWSTGDESDADDDDGGDENASDLDTGGSSGGTDGGTDSGSSTGDPPEPVACFDQGDPGDATCCADLPEPCPDVNHAIRGDFDPEQGLELPVTDVAAAQCVLQALADGEPATLTQLGPQGFVATARRWLVGPDGRAIVVETTHVDFSFDVDFAECELPAPTTLLGCAASDDPQALAICLRDVAAQCDVLPDSEGLTCPQ